MVLRALVLLSESKVLIMNLCQLCSTHYTAKQTKYCAKSTSITTVASMKNTNGVVRPG